MHQIEEKPSCWSCHRDPSKIVLQGCIWNLWWRMWFIPWSGGGQQCCHARKGGQVDGWKRANEARYGGQSSYKWEVSSGYQNSHVHVLSTNRRDGRYDSSNATVVCIHSKSRQRTCSYVEAIGRLYEIELQHTTSYCHWYSKQEWRAQATKRSTIWRTRRSHQDNKVLQELQ